MVPGRSANLRDRRRHGIASDFMTPDNPAGGRLPDELPDNPLPLAQQWFEQAQREAAQRNPNSMSLVTVAADGKPSVRIVLCKDFVTDPGFLVFYTNYASAKGRAIDTDPRVAAVMHWDELGRQIRVEGLAVRSPAGESDAYFASRDRGSQLGAWGSDQSRPIESRDALLAQIRERATSLGIAPSDHSTTARPPPIERPPHWGGYRLWIAALELWIEGADRIHDRARWERRIAPGPDNDYVTGRWRGTRLQP